MIVKTKGNNNNNSAINEYGGIENKQQQFANQSSAKRNIQRWSTHTKRKRNIAQLIDWQQLTAGAAANPLPPRRNYSDIYTQQLAWQFIKPISQHSAKALLHCFALKSVVD